MVKVKLARLNSFEVEDESKVLTPSVDRISGLPRDILGVILSFLTLKEATATSILSHSWNHLWTFTPKLNLKGSLAKVKRKSKSSSIGLESALIEETRSYVEWVDRVISLHQMSNLDEFTIRFDLNASHTKHIDQWLSFALSRKTQRLELSLIDLMHTRSNCSYESYDLCYTFPYGKWNLPDNFKLLKELSTHLVNVRDESVGLFLRNCPLLERVSVSQSQVMSSLEIIRPFPSFKCLEISLCHNLESLVLVDSNVVNIKYRGKRIHNFVLFNVPLLTQLWIGGSLTNRMTDVANMFSSVFPQLELFKIYFRYSSVSWKDTRDFSSAVEMKKLKQMVVCHHNHDDHDSLLHIIHLITASPCLQRLVLEAPIERIDVSRLVQDCASAKRETLKMVPRAYFHLKEIEFVGYCGLRRQFELLMHFVDNNVALENMVVDRRRLKSRLDRPWENIFRRKMDDHEIFARDYAKDQLLKHVPPRINLNML